MLKKKDISQLQEMEFRMDCVKILKAVVVKLQKKSPLKFTTVQDLACLDPALIVKDPAACKRKMKHLIIELVNKKQITGGMTKGNHTYLRHV
jgi:hypothetical protein